MIIHKEYALKRFCEAPLEHKFSKFLLEKLLQNSDLMERLVFVATRDYFPNTMLVAQAGASEKGFVLELGTLESEQITLVNGRLLKEKKTNREARIEDPLEAWQVLQDFRGTLHVQLVFKDETPDWYEELMLPSEAVSKNVLVPGFAAFIREEIDLVLWGVILKDQIEQALETKDETLFRKSARLYKQVCQSCFWKLS